MASFAEVTVDTGTGRVTPERLVIVYDCGTVMYASGAEAQQIGGQCMAVGESLTEEIVYDRQTGIPLNFNWIDYKVPTMADMPDIDPVLLEVWKGDGGMEGRAKGEDERLRSSFPLSFRLSRCPSPLRCIITLAATNISHPDSNLQLAMSDSFTFIQLLLIGLAGMAGGAVNALAGGGKLITFPVLTAEGIPPVAASITNTVALSPGYFGATLAQLILFSCSSWHPCA